MEQKFKNFKWDSPTNFENEAFKDYDFSGSQFDNVLFIGCTFENCIFKKGNAGNLGIFGCDFSDCTFDSFDFKKISVGANGGKFTSCKFTKCNFTGRQFEYPHFDSCVFDQCKIKNVNFNDASFKRTKFIGKIEDTTFNGLYHKKSTGYKIIDEVDFSMAVFGDFVTFEDCDLSNSIPPNGKRFEELLYQIYADDPKTLSTGSTDRIVIRK
jgi:fluoroquinolone resistance protein